MNDPNRKDAQTSLDEFNVHLDDVIEGSIKSEAKIHDLTRKFGEKLDDLLSKLLVSGQYREVLRDYIGEQYDEKCEKETPQYLSLQFIVAVLGKIASLLKKLTRSKLGFD